MTWVQDDRLQTCVQLERFPWAAGAVSRNVNLRWPCTSSKNLFVQSNSLVMLLANKPPWLKLAKLHHTFFFGLLGNMRNHLIMIVFLFGTLFLLASIIWLAWHGPCLSSFTWSNGNACIGQRSVSVNKARNFACLHLEITMERNLLVSPV